MGIVKLFMAHKEVSSCEVKRSILHQRPCNGCCSELTPSSICAKTCCCLAALSCFWREMRIACCCFGEVAVGNCCLSRLLSFINSCPIEERSDANCPCKLGIVRLGHIDCEAHSEMTMPSPVQKRRMGPQTVAFCSWTSHPITMIFPATL